MKRFGMFAGAACVLGIALTVFNATKARVERPQTGSSGAVDPCTIALTAPADGDEKIVQLQRQARTAKAGFERLGWGLIDKARQSADPGFYALAEQTARCMESRAPGLAEALVLRGHALHNLHRFKEAEAIARTLVERRGLWFDYALLGDVTMEQGNLPDALLAYQAMMERKPGPLAYARAAHMRWLHGDLDGAIEAMQMALRASGAGRTETGAWMVVRLAFYTLQAHRLSETARLLDSVLATRPHYAPALLAKGRLLIASDQFEDAVALLAEAARARPLPEYQWPLIDALRAVGRDAEARRIEAALHQSGTAEDARTYALYLATTDQQSEKAVALARAELEVRQDVFTLDALAWSAQAAGRFDEAHALSERALSVGTQDARLFYHAAVIAAARDDTEAAARWSKKARALEHTLLPSERRHLHREFAALNPQVATLAAK